MRDTLESGRGSTQQDYMAFWHDGQGNNATAVHIKYPPHESPRGSILEELVVDAIRQVHPQVHTVRLHGALSMYGADRELVVGDGRVGSASLEGTGWRVHL